MRPALIIALGVACLPFPLAGAPVLGVDPAASDGLATPWPATAASAQMLPPPSMRALDRAMTPQASTGVGELDLLLQSASRPPRPDAPSQRPTPMSAAAASAAAAELAALRLKASQLATSPSPEPAERRQQARQALPLQPLGNLGTLQGDARAVVAPQRREWMGDGEAGGGPARALPARGSIDPPPGLDPDHPLRRWPREVIEFMRDNRFVLLALGGLIMVLVALLKLYSRRV